MKRRMTRLFCLLLSSAMMLTGNAYGALKYPGVIEVSAAETEAAAETKTYTMKELKELTSWVDKTTDKGDGVSVTYGSQYQEKRYEIPTELRGRVESITVNIEEEQSKNLAIKVYDNVSDFTENKGVKYESTSIKNTEWNSGIDVQSFGLMWLRTFETGTTTDITLKSVTFTLSDAGIPAGDCTYNITDLKVKSTYNAEVVPSDNGGVDININGQYDEARFEVPAEIANRVEAITVNGDGNYGKMSVKMLYADAKSDGDEKELFNVAYGNNSVSKENPGLTPILYVGIMSLSEQPVTFHVDSITFTLNDGKESEPIEKKVDLSLKPVRDALKENGLLAGTCIPASALKDEERMKLVTHHFNSVTCENEMKPDAFLSNATFEGNNLVALDFSQGDAVADALLEYNAAHPDQEPIRMRGHVLVWHSQTPDKFFYKDGDTSKELLSQEEMLVRLEQYIKLVMEHYYGKDSKYKDLIYAWDVVNEQANDDGANPGIRMGTMWAKVFGGSDEYIRKAFVYANQYAPENVKLFYNDYNDTAPAKSGYICELLKAIKATEGARIDGMGMQAHYNISSPSYEEFETAIKNYSAIVDEVHLTELDMKGSDDYDGKFHDVEYAKQAYRYKGYYDSILKLNKEGTGKVTAITFWGTDDGNSWLNDFNGAGGGADGKHKVCPLLFDKTYAAKPTYWVFVDQSKLPAEPPVIKNAKAVNAKGTGDASEEKFGSNDTNVSFKTAWDANALKVKISVEDAVYHANDKIKVYYDLVGTRNTGDNIKVIEVSRADAIATGNGYEAYVTIRPEEGKNLPSNMLFDVRVEDGENAVSWSDTTNSQDSTNIYLGALSLAAKVLPVKKGSPDSIDSEVWNSTDAVSLDIVGSAPEATAGAKILWDEENLYVKVDVVDAALDATSTATHEQDSVEIFIDEGNEKTDSYDGNDKQYRVNYQNEQSFNGSTCKAENITSTTKTTDNGYTIYSKIKWTSMSATPDAIIGLDVQINDGKGGTRIGTLNLFDGSGMGWSKSSVFGSAKLIVGEIPEDKEDVIPTTYKANVINGTGSGCYTEAATVTISADAAPSGKVFNKWVVEGDNVQLADATKATTTFVMPANVVTATAIYANAPVSPQTPGNSGSGATTSPVTKPEVKPETKPETVVEKNEDGSTTETSKVTVATADGKEVETSVAVSKDADGNVTGANATVSAKKGEFSADVIKQLAEAAGTESIAVTAEVKDAKGKVSYTVTADSKDLKAGATMKVVAIDKKTGKYELVNAKSYTVDKDGNISVSLPKGADYKLLSEKESAKVEKAIVKTIAVEKKSAAVKEGKSTKIKMSSKLNMDNVKKITYTTSKKSIATVNKNGKISAKKKGTVTVKATVTLKNGKKKTVSMKITVK